MAEDNGIGYIGLFRELLNKPIWHNSTPEQKVILITLLLMANHQEKEWEWRGTKFKARPGQFVTSLDSIQKNAGKGISQQNVRTALNRFEKLEFLTNQSTKTGRLITIVNWELYQVRKLRANKAINTDLTNDSQTPNKDLTPNNNDKNDKNVRTNNSRPNKFADNSIELILARELYNFILGNNPNAKEPNLQSWAKSFDLMIRIDKRSVEAIRLVMKWCQMDSFWFKNILSADKLRNKFDQLTIQMKSSPGKANGGQQKTSPDKYKNFYL